MKNDETINAVHADRIEARLDAEFVRTVRELMSDIEKAHGVVSLSRDVTRLNQSKANGMRWALEVVCRNRGVSVSEAKGMASMMEKAERTARQIAHNIAVTRGAPAILHARGDEREAAFTEGMVLGLEWALEVVCRFHGLDVQAVKEGMEDDEQDDG